MCKIKQLAQEAMQVQDACNLLGVSKRFPLAIQELADELRSRGEHTGTDCINRHPITQAWVNKLMDLSGGDRVDFGAVIDLSNS